VRLSPSTRDALARWVTRDGIDGQSGKRLDVYFRESVVDDRVPAGLIRVMLTTASAHPAAV